MSEPRPFGELGVSPETVDRSLFVKTQRLVETKPGKGPSYTYHPSESEREDFIRFYARTDGDDRLHEVELALDRDWAANNRLRSLDILTSFLRSALDAADRDCISALLEELEQEMNGAASPGPDSPRHLVTRMLAGEEMCAWASDLHAGRQLLIHLDDRTAPDWIFVRVYEPLEDED